MLTLTRISLQDNFRKYYFEEFSRPDFVCRSVILVVDFDFNITSIMLNSAAHGLLTFSFQKGITENAAWETAEEKRDFFDARKHYPSPSPVGRKVDAEKMLADVLSASPSTQFSEMVRRFISDTSQKIRYEYERYHVVFPGNKKAGRSFKIQPAKSFAETWEIGRRTQIICPRCHSSYAFSQSRCPLCYEVKPPFNLLRFLNFFILTMMSFGWILYALFFLTMIVYFFFYS